MQLLQDVHMPEAVFKTQLCSLLADGRCVAVQKLEQAADSVR